MTLCLFRRHQRLLWRINEVSVFDEMRAKINDKNSFLDQVNLDQVKFRPCLRYVLTVLEVCFQFVQKHKSLHRLSFFGQVLTCAGFWKSKLKVRTSTREWQSLVHCLGKLSGYRDSSDQIWQNDLMAFWVSWIPVQHVIWKNWTKWEVYHFRRWLSKNKQKCYNFEL